MTVATGLFVGLITLDLIYQVERVPASNQKIVALDTAIAAGGPATNAAVAFQYLGDRATLVGVLGQHPLAGLIQSDLQQCRVDWLDLEPQRLSPPPTSSILVTRQTGDRAIISLNAVRSQATPEQIAPPIWTALEQGGVDIVLLDGHQIAVGEAIARRARDLGIPVLVDGGSWKPGFERLLPWVDYAICSAQFCPPGCHGPTQVMDYLRSHDIPQIAITHGEQPIEYCWGDQAGTVDVPAIQPVDTLAAGDVFHGALCHFLLRDRGLAAIAQAAEVAARACQSFGTRHWMT